MKSQFQKLLRVLSLLLLAVGLSFAVGAQNNCECPAPTKVKVNNITSNSAQVSWSAPPVPVLGYTIKLKNVATGVETTIDIGLSNPYTLTGLSPNTPYEVRIIANCTASCKSVPSTPVKFQTQPFGIIIEDVIVQASSSAPMGLSPKGTANSSMINWMNSYTGTQYVKVSTHTNNAFWIKRVDINSYEILNSSGSGFFFNPISAGGLVVPVVFTNNQVPYSLEMTTSGIRVTGGSLSLQLFY